MERKPDSIYRKDLKLEGYININLSASDRMMIVESLKKSLRDEDDIMPAVYLIRRIMEGDY